MPGISFAAHRPLNAQPARHRPLIGPQQRVVGPNQSARLVQQPAARTGRAGVHGQRRSRSVVASGRALPAAVVAVDVAEHETAVSSVGGELEVRPWLHVPHGHMSGRPVLMALLEVWPGSSTDVEHLTSKASGQHK